MEEPYQVSPWLNVLIKHQTLLKSGYLQPGTLMYVEEGLCLSRSTLAPDAICIDNVLFYIYVKCLDDCWYMECVVV